jgi:hypothetical protein
MSFGIGFQEKLSGHLVALYYFIKLNEKNKVNLFSSFKKKKTSSEPARCAGLFIII